MNFQKSMLAGACALGLGLATTSASAAVLDIIDMHLEDWGSGPSDFAFFSPPAGANIFASGGGDGATFLTDGVTTVGPSVISTGFNFGTTGTFTPRILAGGIDGSLDTGAGNAVTWSAFNLGGNFPFTGGNSGAVFTLPPDDLGAVTTTVTDLSGSLGPDKYGVTVTYIGTITDPGSFINFPANWSLNAVITTASVPVPAAAWLFGSGLIGLVGIARRRRKA